MLEKLQMYFAYDFVKFALIVGVLVALCAALLGVTLVLKRYSMIGDGLSHMAFGAMTVAMLFSIAPIYLTLPVTILSAVLLLRGGGKLKGDAAVAMLSVSSLAMGYLLLNIFKSGSANLSGDVCSILFGSTSILTLKKSDVVLCAVLAALVLFVFVFFYNNSITICSNTKNIWQICSATKCICCFWVKSYIIKIYSNYSITPQFISSFFQIVAT